VALLLLAWAPGAAAMNDGFVAAAGAAAAAGMAATFAAASARREAGRQPRRGPERSLLERQNRLLRRAAVGLTVRCVAVANRLILGATNNALTVIGQPRGMAPFARLFELLSRATGEPELLLIRRLVPQLEADLGTGGLGKEAAAILEAVVKHRLRGMLGDMAASEAGAREALRYIVAAERATRGAAQQAVVCFSNEELLEAVASVPPVATPGRRCAAEGIIFYLGYGRFGYVARMRRPRARADVAFPAQAAAAAGARAPNQGAQGLYRAPLAQKARWSGNIAWWRLGNPINTAEEAMNLLTLDFKVWLFDIIAANPAGHSPLMAAAALRAPGGAPAPALVRWAGTVTKLKVHAALHNYINWAMQLPPAIGAPGQPRAVPLSGLECRRILSDAGFSVKIRHAAAAAIIFSKAFGDLFEPHVEAIFSTRVKSNREALVPLASPRGASNDVPVFTRHVKGAYTLSFPRVAVAVTPFCDAPTGALLLRELQRQSGLVARYRAFGMDVLALAFAMLLQDQLDGRPPPAAHIPDLSDNNVKRALFTVACLGADAQPNANLHYVVAAREALAAHADLPHADSKQARQKGRIIIFESLARRYWATAEVRLGGARVHGLLARLKGTIPELLVHIINARLQPLVHAAASGRFSQEELSILLPDFWGWAKLQHGSGRQELADTFYARLFGITHVKLPAAAPGGAARERRLVFSAAAEAAMGDDSLKTPLEAMRLALWGPLGKPAAAGRTGPDLATFLGGAVGKRTLFTRYGFMSVRFVH
jgi:hypothetical protein